MLQSNDRWPYWDQEFEGDEEPNREQQVTERTADNRKKTTGNRKLDDAPKSSTADMLKYASLGTELVAGVLVGVFLGWLFNWITGYKGPWALAIGVVIGALSGFLNLYRALVEEEQKEERNKSGSSH